MATSQYTSNCLNLSHCLISCWTHSLVSVWVAKPTLFLQYNILNKSWSEAGALRGKCCVLFSALVFNSYAHRFLVFVFFLRLSFHPTCKQSICALSHSKRHCGLEIHQGKWCGGIFLIERYVVCIGGCVFEAINVQDCVYYQQSWKSDVCTYVWKCLW